MRYALKLAEVLQADVLHHAVVPEPNDLVHEPLAAAEGPTRTAVLVKDAYQRLPLPVRTLVSTLSKTKAALFKERARRHMAACDASIARIDAAVDASLSELRTAAALIRDAVVTYQHFAEKQISKEIHDRLKVLGPVYDGAALELLNGDQRLASGVLLQTLRDMKKRYSEKLRLGPLGPAQAAPEASASVTRVKELVLQDVQAVKQFQQATQALSAGQACKLPALNNADDFVKEVTGDLVEPEQAVQPLQSKQLSAVAKHQEEADLMQAFEKITSVIRFADMALTSSRQMGQTLALDALVDARRSMLVLGECPSEPIAYASFGNDADLAAHDSIAQAELKSLLQTYPTDLTKLDSCLQFVRSSVKQQETAYLLEDSRRWRTATHSWELALHDAVVAVQDAWNCRTDI